MKKNIFEKQSSLKSKVVCTAKYTAQYAVQLGLAGIILMQLSACGKSDSTADYQNLKLVPVHTKNYESQEVLNQMLNISLLTEDGEKRVPVAFEGEPTEIKFKLDVMDSDITAADVVFVDSGKPQNSSLVASKTEANVWIFKWTPPVGFIDPGQVERDIDLMLAARVVSSKNSKLQNIVTRHAEKILVRHTQVIPKIVGSDKPEAIEEGSDLRFKIKVQDPSQNKNSQPDVTITEYKGARNDENHKYDWSKNITADQPFVEGPDQQGVYALKFILHTKDLKLPVPPLAENLNKPDEKATGVNLCFTATAQSKLTGLRSPSQDYCVRVRFAAQAPVIYWEQDPTGEQTTFEVEAGKTYSLPFTVKVPNARGEMNFLSQNVLFAESSNAALALPKVSASLKWPSEKNESAYLNPLIVPVAETAQNPVEKKYVFTWTPECNSKGVHILKMGFSTKVDNRVKIADFTKRFLITKNADICAAKAEEAKQQAAVKQSEKQAEKTAASAAAAATTTQASKPAAAATHSAKPQHTNRRSTHRN